MTKAKAKAIVLSVGLSVSAPCFGVDPWVSVMTRSYHNDRTQGYNEKNWGLGIEQDIYKGWRFSVGTYRNSFSRRSTYIGGLYTPIHFGNNSQWSFGGTLGLVSGYKGGVLPYAAPVLTWEGKKVGVNILSIPGAVTAIQVKAKF